ncbi:MAG: hypothetical protein KGQ93_01620 [Cyanobacteria bacterium REEB459]|nr:hypothetical protein [Cyanobacteria bacterium REEB459]
MIHPLKLSSLWAATVAMATLVALTPVALAQSASTDPRAEPVVDPNTGFTSADSGNGLFGQSSSPFDLIHRAVLMNDMSLSDFSHQHQNRMSSEAASFRQQQQQVLKGQSTQGQAPLPVSPATKP